MNNIFAFVLHAGNFELQQGKAGERNLEDYLQRRKRFAWESWTEEIQTEHRKRR